MKCTIYKNEFLKASSLFHGICEKRSTMPILANFLLEAKGKGEIQLFATDLEIAVSTSCRASIKESGCLCVPEKKIHEIVREMESDEIEISSLENHWARIETKRSVFQVVGLNAQDYPKAFEGKEEKKVKLNRDLLAGLIDRTIFAVMEADYVQYNGILMESEKSMLRMVATDGHRLALSEKETEAAAGAIKSEGVLIPRKGARELRRILAEMPEELEVGVGGGFLSVTGKDGEGTKVMVRLLEGKFPNYREVIPKRFACRLNVSKEDFLASLKRMSILSTPLSQGVRFRLSANDIELSIKNPDLGEASGHVAHEAKSVDEGLETLFNVHYLIDALEVFGTEKVELCFSGPEGALLLKPMGEKEEGYLSLVMPMRT